MSDTVSDSESGPQHFFTLLKKFDFTMMVTGSGESQRVRPMTIVQIDDTGTVWFVCSLDAHTRALELDPRAMLVCQSQSVYLVLNGTGRVVRDESKIDELWKDTFKVWFPQGRSSPDLALIAVAPISGEYWD